MSTATTTFAVPSLWSEIVAAPVVSGLRILVSEASNDLQWDAFLLSTPAGQYQQSSTWGRVKQAEGWHPTRFIAVAGDEIVGGFQVLWKRKFGVRFGYVTKGPVVATSVDDVGRFAELLKVATAHLGLAALVVQAPDSATEIDHVLANRGFGDYRLQKVIEATIVVDLGRDLSDVQHTYSRSTRKTIKKAQSAGVTTRLGRGDECARFFELMAGTCRRIGTAPSPASAGAIASVLSEFNRSDNPKSIEASLLLAEQNGAVIAGHLLVRFGATLSLWKTGALEPAARLGVTKLLNDASFRHGAEIGCTRAEIVGCSRAAAEAFLRDNGRDETTIASSDAMKLGFGGVPVLLPTAKVWIPGRILRSLYAAASNGRRG